MWIVALQSRIDAAELFSLPYYYFFKKFVPYLNLNLH